MKGLIYDYETCRELVELVKMNYFFESEVLEIRTAIYYKDIQLIKRTAHKIKYGSKNICFTRLAQVAEEMEYLENYDQVNLNSLLDEIENEVRILASILETE